MRRIQDHQFHRKYPERGSSRSVACAKPAVPASLGDTASCMILYGGRSGAGKYWVTKSVKNKALSEEIFYVAFSTGGSRRARPRPGNDKATPVFAATASVSGLFRTASYSIHRCGRSCSFTASIFSAANGTSSDPGNPACGTAATPLTREEEAQA